MTVLPEHRCELVYLMSTVLMKDIDINMHGSGLLFMPLEGTKIAKSRLWSVVPLTRRANYKVLGTFDSGRSRNEKECLL